MLKIFTIRKSNKKVESIGDSENIIDKTIFDIKEVDCTQEELDNWLNNSSDLYFKERPEIIESEAKLKEKAKKKAINEVLTELQTATTVSKVKEQVIKLISNL